MEIKPTDLKAKFNQVFNKHRELEENPEFLSKKRKHQDLNLESQHNTNALSEIFQDPDLLARISEDAHMIMRETAVRASRVRHEHDIITQKKPQAKDVITRRLVGNEIVDIYDSLETAIDRDSEYLNPIAPKRRKYLAEESDDLSSITSSPQEAVLEADPVSLPVPIEPLTIANNGVILALPAVQKPVDSIHNDQLPEKSELERLLEETSVTIKQSPLKTVGSKHLYTLLPRQCEINAYRYVKEDYTPAENQTKQINTDIEETLITISIFNPQNVNLKFQEIEILGSQMFSDLRDAMYCTSDFLRNGNKKNQAADGNIINTPQKKLSPSMIYMDHVFYIDTRDASSASYDSLINTWMMKKRVNTEVFRFEKKDMQAALLENMSMKLQQPIAFIHQNDCEHMMVIQDIKLVSDSEYKSKAELPRTTHNLRYDRFKCSMCTIFPATKITYEDIISGFSPCYFCDICFESFHGGDADVITTVEYAGVPGRETKRYRSHKKESQ